MAAMLDRVSADIVELTNEKERIKARRQQELDEIDLKITTLKRAQRKLQADPELEEIVAALSVTVTTRKGK